MERNFISEREGRLLYFLNNGKRCTSRKFGQASTFTVSSVSMTAVLFFNLLTRRQCIWENVLFFISLFVCLNRKIGL